MSNALENLNQLFEQQEDRVLFPAWESRQAINLSLFLESVRRLVSKLGNLPEERWLLYSHDPLNFAAGMLAMLALKRDMIICASNQPGWLASIADQFDAVLSDNSIEPGDKQIHDFAHAEFSESTLKPVFSGQESVTFLTSGSTGPPKPVIKPLQALTNEVTTLAATFPECTQGCNFAASVSHLHIYGLLFNILLPLLYRSGIVPVMVEYHEQLQKVQEKVDDLVFISSPALLSRLDLRIPVPGLRKVFSSGGPLGYEAAQDCNKCLFMPPVEVYGSTETGGIAWRQQKQIDTHWQPFDGVELCDIDGETRIVSGNMPGAEPYVLDDNLVLFPDGSFMLKGRKDRIVKIEEKRVSLTEIEQFMQAREEIRQCHSIVIAGRRTRIGCIVVLADMGNEMLEGQGRKYLLELWRSALRSRFEAATIPRKWHFSEAIPVNSQGKIDHQFLLSLFKEGA